MQVQQRSLFALIAATAAAAASALTAHAQKQPVDGIPAVGRTLALQICTGCHVVAPDQPFKPVFTGPPHPPDFKEIANKPNVTAAGLRRHLSSLPAVPKLQRPSMANAELTSEQLRDCRIHYESAR